MGRNRGRTARCMSSESCVSDRSSGLARMTPTVLPWPPTARTLTCSKRGLLSAPPSWHTLRNSPRSMAPTLARVALGQSPSSSFRRRRVFRLISRGDMPRRMVDGSRPRRLAEPSSPVRVDSWCWRFSLRTRASAWTASPMARTSCEKRAPSPCFRHCPITVCMVSTANCSGGSSSRSGPNTLRSSPSTPSCCAVRSAAIAFTKGSNQCTSSCSTGLSAAPLPSAISCSIISRYSRHAASSVSSSISSCLW
mmetsp:Transcript_8714/g.27381  ORF Transcript_8714/g.27381 Transcript_8714/m.27381 type:complete len:251 (-) Transcript_8714:484-1236(-)